MRKVAGAMATLSGLRRTYFSTPSTETHEAYAYWNGDRWNEKRPRINASVFLWTGKRCITDLSALTGHGGRLSRWKMWLITAGNTPILTKSVMKTPKTSSSISTCVSLSAKGNRHLT
ncbi:hypothetical protein DMN57_27750 [Escherichia coli]|nr:hypothetical protein [Escherichia coli]